MVFRSLFLSSALLAQAAHATDFAFCWHGGGGYAMTGYLTVSDAASDNAVVTEDDVSAFHIAGFHNGQPLGTWDLSQRDKDTVWHLRFDPARAQFMMGGSFPTAKSQGWNASGHVTDCGNPGFGFNAGNAAQDVCVNGRFIAESSVSPDTPMIVSRGTRTPECRLAELTS